jgi:alpha-beta hydrolase superfamily lysophospholipase
MQIREYRWKSFDNLDYYFVSWEPEEKPLTVIALVHGLGDHCRRYDRWIEGFAKNRIATVSFDFRGHGRSEGKKGVINEFEDLLADTKLLIEKTKELFPGIPLILYGHSMGGIISMRYCLQNEELPDFAIITSPWVKLKYPPSALFRLLIRLAGKLIPNSTFSTGLHSDDFSENNEFAGERERDELLHNRISPRLFLEISKQYEKLFNNIETLKVPMLLMHGKEDPVTDIEGSREVFTKSKVNIDYKEWDGAKHHLHNFTGSSEVMDFIIKWIMRKI